MKANFNFIAPVYDQLARLVFGRSIVDSQLFFLDEIPARAKVLILGGGTGWLLEELLLRKPDCSICYIEASSKMLTLTHQRKLNEKTKLIHGTETDIPLGSTFDVVITNFYLDLFPESKLNTVIKKITAHTNSTSAWIVTDFNDQEKWWQRAMLKIMYIFFKSTSSVETMDLADWKKKMLQHQWQEQYCNLWYRGFIKSAKMKRQ